MVHARHHEQAHGVIDSPERRRDGFVIVDGVAWRDQRIGPAVIQEKFTASGKNGRRFGSVALIKPSSVLSANSTSLSTLSVR
jgi:hypothetical protein